MVFIRSHSCAHQVSFIYELPLRATWGFFGSLFSILTIDFQFPCYAKNCRRSKRISAPLPFPPPKGSRVIVLYSTGLKVCGEGEWKARQHGTCMRKTWRKSILGLMHILKKLFVGLSQPMILKIVSF